MKMRRWAGAAVALPAFVGGASLLGGAAELPAAGPPPAAVGPTALLPTPLLSVRRAPAWIESTLAEQKLTAALGPVLAGQLNGTSTGSGCVLVAQGSTVLFSSNPTQELLPASDLKLLTATALLDRLGADFRLTTRVMTPATTTANGVLSGNLYLIGGGDPRLLTDAYEKDSYVAGFDPSPPVYTSLDELAAQVKQAGVRVVTGSVLGDDSRFDQQRSVPTWEPVYESEGDVAPLSALEVNYDTPPAAPPTPPSADNSGAASTTTTVPGSPPPPPPDPPVNAATIFADALRQQGVTVEGGAATGTTPAGARLITQIQSPPLATELQAMVRVSDDTAAELLTKELGYQVSHEGSTTAGTAAIRSVLAADGLPVDQLTNLDGSGLDRGDRATCNLLNQVLARAGPTGVLAQGLPVAGQTGTLLHRLSGTPAAGRLAGKTGTLQDVATLSGLITAPASAPTAALKAPIVFSMIVNGPGYTKGQDLIDKVALVLAAYPAVPPLAAVAPRS
ncbi:MAG: D-alanyl-D-alanine carboxypeptidase/D-alanyl-D-alanine-endopeptidase [Acidimicrobiales bacterium]|nr:D-alanyl-D-alanine carboxypeptidase/D-alanyl-D-alanine-endopeptidase [Acidimicrobiales bacterium]